MPLKVTLRAAAKVFTIRAQLGSSWDTNVYLKALDTYQVSPFFPPNY